MGRSAQLLSLLVVAGVLVGAGEARADGSYGHLLPPAPSEYGHTVVSPTEPAEQPRRRTWPRHFALRLDGTWARLDWGAETFSDREEVYQMPGLTLDLGQLDLAGVELATDVVLHGPIHVSGGIGFYGPIGGTAGGVVPVEGDPTVGDVHLVSWFGDLGLAQRLGDLTFAGSFHFGLERTLVELEGDCACPSYLRAKRWTAGPRVALRAHLYRAMFVEASFRTSLLRRGDHQVTLGVGVGQGRRLGDP